LLAIQGGVGIVSLVVFRVIFPEASNVILSQAGKLFVRETATEATSLFTPDLFILLRPVAQIGLAFYFGLIALSGITWVVATRYEPAWLVMVIFSWYYMLLAAFQARFAAHLTFFLSVFAGISCLHLLAKIEVSQPIELFISDKNDKIGLPGSLPERQRVVYTIAIIGIIISANFIYVPTLINQTTYTDEQFEATQTIEEHATAVGHDYPESAVDAKTGDVRMYNYFVNGESEKFQTHLNFLLPADNPDTYSLREGGKYIVLTEQPPYRGPGYTMLFEGLGVGLGEVSKTSGRFKPIYVGEEIRAFTKVEGAIISISGATSTEVTATTQVTVAGNETSYERSAPVTNNKATIRVAHPGTYTVDDTTVVVSNNDVQDGERISLPLN
jgi:dolichyl-diphosphooligosaccharide--protein glycosyltransferase